MVAEVDVANRALSSTGSRGITQIASLTEDSNEAAACNLWFGAVRDELLRMAPWNCATNTETLALLKSAPGTPEFTGDVPEQWNKTLPTPPWAYSYAYPNNCLRPCWIIPQFATGMAGVPITTAVTGGVPTYWNGPAVRYRVAIDQDDDGNDIKVILTNQEDAILVYVKQVTNPDIWDMQFQQAMVAALAGRIVFSLTGDKDLANAKLKEANLYITMARQGDGNEGLTINDVVPDWIRVRGVAYPSLGINADTQFDWGPALSYY